MPISTGSILVDKVLLPPGTIYSSTTPSGKYYYKRFIMDGDLLIDLGHFDWEEHIARTFYACMKPTMNKFMKVV